MEVTIENAAYTRYLSEIVQVTPETSTYEFEFVMGQTDMTAMKFLLGRTEGSPLGAHDVTIDNVSVTLTLPRLKPWDSEVLVRAQSISVLLKPSDEGVPSPLLRQTL